MAFVLDRTWDATAPGRGAAFDSAAFPFPPAPLLSNGRDRYAWKTGASLLSLLVHIFILWIFLTRLAGGVGEGAGGSPRSAILHSFSLSGPSASAAATERETQDVQPLPRASARPSNVNASAETGLVPEWSVSRLPPRPEPPGAQSTPAAAASASASGSAPGGAAGGAGNDGGGGVYDPYAGAAPLRRQRGAASGAPSLGDRVLGFFGFGPRSFGGLTLDEEALDSVLRSVAGRLPGRRGTAELTVRVSPTGVVLDVSARGGSAPPEARDALGRALVGKRLFLGKSVDAQTLTLPTLRLG